LEITTGMQVILVRFCKPSSILLTDTPSVARVVSDNVTGSQCASHYGRALDPSVKRDEWTEAELDRLKEAVGVWGTSWVDIARCLPGRTNELCREKWQEHLIQLSAKAEWTSEKDQQLLRLVSEMGTQWKAISNKIGNGANANKVCSLSEVFNIY
jgi:hypothetical protein